jgi:Raf kinase inhibitor-like YbhB/YbcL family protein
MEGPRFAYRGDYQRTDAPVSAGARIIQTVTLHQTLHRCIALALFFFVSACARGDSSPTLGTASTPTSSGGQTTMAVQLTLTSSGFAESQAIPRKYSCDAENVSPPLKWTSLPQGTQSIALIADDPDAPAGTWVHWVIYNIPPTTTELAEGLPATESVLNSALQGTNDFRRIGYGGPCPPRGNSHRYFFKLYALDTLLNLKAGASKKDVLSAMEGHILAQGQLMGTYKRA